ncbi:MAG: tol-pal system-associated acyl-CoA thioesterase [Methylotenera sp.]|jgi:acyl-CoA thioester hydrolase|nr:tol-pal system-associated acyl-CoA thioesterase [Methylotenera sp.]
MNKQIKFTWPVRVYYEDTDAGGVVYHSNYLNFMERARTEWLRALGFEQPELKDKLGVLIVVHSLSVVFKSPAYFNDLLAVHCDITKIGKSSIEIAQKITSSTKSLIDAHVKVAFVHADTFKPIGIPEQIKQAMLAKQVEKL